MKLHNIVKYIANLMKSRAIVIKLENMPLYRAKYHCIVLISYNLKLKYRIA